MPLRRIRQALAAIAEEKIVRRRDERLIISWQTRSLAMVIARASGTGDEELMKFAANLTIDNEEYEQFKDEGYQPVKQDPKLVVHATTQEEATKRNFDAAADKNSMDMLAIFGMRLEKGKPGD